jgi:deoxyribodipyrimidine photo-lyase
LHPPYETTRPGVQVVLGRRGLMGDRRPVILWLRRDLRLADHPALSAAVARGGPVIPVFVHDEVVETMGAAPLFRLGEGLRVFGRALESHGSRLILRRGRALDVIRGLVAETGAGVVFWSRLYDPAARARDSAVKAALKAEGIEARSFAGHLLFEPWDVLTGLGGYYRVFTPMWRAVRGRDPGSPLPAPVRLPAPESWPASDRLEDWRLGAAMRRGAAVVAPYMGVGEETARDRLAAFVERNIETYAAARDLPGEDATSHLAENLTLGEIGARTVWAAGWRAHEEGRAGAETFVKELVWREFAHQLAYNTPHIVERNWKPDWDAFPWEGGDTPAAEVWRRGRTGIPFVDAAMREMYVTGTMHNRGRMIVASFLTKHLLTHWKVGADWFADCLIDWDPASNAMGWQWAAGSGPDAAPYFRVFNPVSQLEKFDPRHLYPRRWIAEGQRQPPATALTYFDAIPAGWGMSSSDPYPAPIVTPEAGRERALAAYAARGLSATL